MVRIYKQERKFDNLVEICRKAVNAQPNDASLLAELGSAYLYAEKPEEACRVFKKLIGMENDNPAFYCRWGELNSHEFPHNDEALRLLNDCISVNPSNSLYYCALGDILVALGQTDEALAAYKTAIKYDNAGAGVYYNRLGQTLMKAKFFSQAIDAFKAAIELDAAKPYYIGLASAYEGMGRVDVARELLQQTKKSN